MALQYLIKKHEARGDKILVFINNPKIAVEYARMLKMPVGTGDTHIIERKVIID